MVDWKKILQIDVPGEVYSKVERRINPQSGREKNFAVKDEIKDIIRNKANCEPKFFPADEGAEVETAEWICKDDDGETLIRGTYLRGVLGEKKVTKLATFDVFTQAGIDTNRSRNIKERLVADYSGVVQFLLDEKQKEMFVEDKLEERRQLTSAICRDFKNEEVLNLIDNISGEMNIDKSDMCIIVSKYKGMPSREKHWVPFAHKLNEYVEKYNLSADDLKKLFSKIDKSGVKIE